MTLEDMEIAYRLAVRSFGSKAVTLRKDTVIICVPCSMSECSSHA